ncbi:multicopper oxidase family protein [Phaeobacter sp. CNT1-3]|nr:multicopper oxidase family protein [Phaeobacter sp. CNT1-3]
MQNMSRRQFIMAAGVGTAVAGGAMTGLGGWDAQASVAQHFALRSRQTSFQFGDHVTKGLISLTDNAPSPVLRVRQGERAVFDYTNGLEDYTSMHWHGIRLPNAMDGVPYLTQMPIGQGETYRYEFTPPDAGTYWYHPHCRTMSQMAHGLTGMLIVEEREDQGFDADIPLNLKDFRIGSDGQMLPYFTARGAARAGTHGNVRTTNWQQDPVMDVPAGGLIRLRFAVTDITRVHRLIFPDVVGRIIAWDGQPVDADIPWPTAEAPLWLAPGQRVDVVVKAPAVEGEELTFRSLKGRNSPFNTLRLRSVGADLKRDIADVKPLPRNPFAHPNVKEAEVRDIVFGWSPEGEGSNNGLCGTFGYTFWSINRSPWPGDVVSGIAPVAELKQGRSYILRMRNESPNLHPIHLHGLVFKPLRSNLRTLPANYTDTILLLKDEVVEVALLADNPGDWAFHCHVIEHQKSGLSGYIRVV